MDVQVLEGRVPWTDLLYSGDPVTVPGDGVVRDFEPVRFGERDPASEEEGGTSGVGEPVVIDVVPGDGTAEGKFDENSFFSVVVDLVVGDSDAGGVDVRPDTFASIIMDAGVLYRIVVTDPFVSATFIEARNVRGGVRVVGEIVVIDFYSIEDDAGPSTDP